LVTGYGNGGGLYQINLQNDRIEKYMEGDLRDICRDHKGYAVVDNHSIFFLDQQLKIYNRHILSDDNLDLHGICYDNGFYYIVETYTNSIKIMSADTLKIEEQLNIKTDKEDLHHINDICVSQEGLYVSMISLSGLPKSFWRDFQDGAIIELDKTNLQPKRIIKDYLSFPHSVKLFNDQIYFCESLKFNLSCVNGVIARFDGFTRGLEFDGTLFYVGQSVFRSTIPSNVDSVSIEAGIHVFDPVFKLKRFIKMPVQNIYAILNLDKI
jgi:hypothetical protein